jgi:peptide/nickel transport system permease protein
MLRRLILTRAASAVVTLLVVSIIVFAMVEALPGDIAAIVLGRFASEAAKEELRLALNLDAPLYLRYLQWLGGFLTGDLGTTLSSQRPIADVVAPRLFNTIMLAAAALAIHFPLMLIVATVQATRRYGKLDAGLSTLTMIVASIPEFLLSLLLLVAFVIFVPLFPAVSYVDADSSTANWLSALALPALTLALVMSVYGIRMLRAGLIDVLEAEFIQVAELRGLSRARVLFRHALPNAIGPVLNITAFNLTYLIGGVVVVEKVFSFPGFGTLMIDAVSFRDVPLVETTVMISAIIYVLANFVSDLLAIVFNPKLKRSQ